MCFSLSNKVGVMCLNRASLVCLSNVQFQVINYFTVGRLKTIVATILIIVTKVLSSS
jgi:hypothetical protein